MKHQRTLYERLFERVLWATRHLMIVAVVAILILAIGAFYYALVDLTYLLSLTLDYAALPPSERSVARDEAVTTIVKALDGFFIGALLIIVAAGLYELFIGRIEAAETSEVGPRLLKISSLQRISVYLTHLHNASIVALAISVRLTTRGWITYRTNINAVRCRRAQGTRRQAGGADLGDRVLPAGAATLLR